VVYVSFGSGACLNAEQMTEIAGALRQTSSNFLWEVKANEDGNLPNKFAEETSGKGLVVAWCGRSWRCWPILLLDVS
jgi:phage-related protein